MKYGILGLLLFFLALGCSREGPNGNVNDQSGSTEETRTSIEGTGTSPRANDGSEQVPSSSANTNTSTATGDGGSP